MLRVASNSSYVTFKGGNVEIKHTFFRSKGSLINKTDDMVRLVIDLPRIEGMKLKHLLEKSHNNEYMQCQICGSNRFIENKCELCGFIVD